MKRKQLTIALFLSFIFQLTIPSFSQSYQLNAKNNKFTGYNNFSGTKTTVGNQPLTESNILTWNQIVSDTAYAIALDDTTNVITGSYTPLYMFKNTFNNKEYQKQLKGWGVNYKLWPLCPIVASGGSTMSDGVIYLTAYDPIVDSTLCTSQDIWMNTAGDYTADNFNGIALYRVDGTSYTRVAVSADSPNLWKTANTTKANVPFVTPYQALPGQLLYLATLYNSSAQVTQPTPVDATSIGSALSSTLLGGDNKLAATLGGQTTMPASITASQTTRTTPMRLAPIK